jgi:uncharacterized protein YndB with AHSA1/START domain
MWQYRLRGRESRGQQRLMPMLARPESACFVIADISGYTSYLAGVELDHAHDILADLMDTIVKALRPPFRLAKFEGDAAFVYAVTDKIDGSLLQDTVEAAYFAFRRRLRNIKQSSTCECNACRRMGTLDLKFITHHGEFIKHAMGGRQELAGRDVIIVHRLLKNAVNERLGGRAYALYSDPCIKAMGIDPAAHDLVDHVEAIDIIGEVRCWVRDLEEAWAKENTRHRVEVTRDKAFGVLDFDIKAPRPTVWEHFTTPVHRPKWQGADVVLENSGGGRRGVGTQNHCVHGKAALIEEVLDWRPFDYVTMDALVPVPNAPKVTLTYAFLDRDDGGTHIEIRIAKPKPKDMAFVEQMAPVWADQFNGAIANLRLMLEGEKGAPAVVDEPEIPVSSERFLTQPLHVH